MTTIPTQATVPHPGREATDEAWEVRVTERERQLLVELLQEEVKNLRSEVYRAETHSVKELLKEREACAKRLMEQFSQDTGSATSTV